MKVFSQMRGNKAMLVIIYSSTFDNCQACILPFSVILDVDFGSFYEYFRKMCVNSQMGPECKKG